MNQGVSALRVLYLEQRLECSMERAREVGDGLGIALQDSRLQLSKELALEVSLHFFLVDSFV
jgi:hypothetical protein